MNAQEFQVPGIAISITRREDVPASLVEGFVDTLYAVSVPFGQDERVAENYEGRVEETPPLIFVGFMEEFFTSFLKGPAADALDLISQELVALALKSLALVPQPIAPCVPRGAGDASPYSHVIAFYSSTLDGVTVKFLIPSAAGESELRNLVDAMFGLLRAAYAAPSISEIPEFLRPGDPNRWMRVLDFDQRLNQWLPWYPSSGQRAIS